MNAGHSVNKFFLILFAILGVADFCYGIFYHDSVSVVAGGLIAGIAVYVALRQKKR
jgi:hypothetical protein